MVVRRIWVHPLEVDSCTCRVSCHSQVSLEGSTWPRRPESSAAMSQAVQTAGISGASSWPEPQYARPIRGLWFFGRVRSSGLPMESHGHIRWELNSPLSQGPEAGERDEKSSSMGE